MYTKRRRMQTPRVFKVNKRLHRNPTPAGASAGTCQALCPAVTQLCARPLLAHAQQRSHMLKALPCDPWYPAHVTLPCFTNQSKNTDFLSFPPKDS